MARSTAGLVLIALFVFPSMILGTEFVVGGDDGWKAGVVDYSAWASSYTFSARDVLVFSYFDTTEYNIVVATGPDAFANCVASPNLGVYNTGHDVLELTDGGSYYFFSQGHCHYDDMNFMINVLVAMVEEFNQNGRPPPFGYLKINMDGAFDAITRTKHRSWGFLVRDSQGIVIAGNGGTIRAFIICGACRIDSMPSCYGVCNGKKAHP